ncbi:MAG: hypothetical protein HDS24_03200 [Bacteroides sp.]|nr:hypothetical protein [Bacteroides sp.]
MKCRFFLVILFLSVVLAATSMTSCSRSAKSSDSFPKELIAASDQARLDYVMKSCSPDSLARFIIYSALGKNGEVRIDTFALATNYVYEHLKDQDAVAFSSVYDDLIERLPLPEKMRIYALAGSEDPQGLGYRLGLEYLASIREGGKSAADIDREMEALKNACADDTMTYHRFIIGFRTVLNVDSGKGIPAEIYRKYSK